MRKPGSLVLFCLCIGLLAPPAWAGPPASIDPSASASPSVERSFQGFARRWLRDAAQRGAAMEGHRRRIGSEFEVEVRPTGRASVPWVGIVRYAEERYRCANPSRCKLLNKGTVAEVFRYQNGRWVY